MIFSKPVISGFEKIIYLADYIEPTRDFDGINELRGLACEDLDRAMELGLRMTMDELSASGRPIDPETVRTYEWYRERAYNEKERI